MVTGKLVSNPLSKPLTDPVSVEDRSPMMSRYADKPLLIAVFGMEMTSDMVAETLRSTDPAVPITDRTPLNNPDTSDDFNTLSAADLMDDVVVPTILAPYLALRSDPVVVSALEVVDPVIDCGERPVCADVSFTRELRGCVPENELLMGSGISVLTLLAVVLLVDESVNAFDTDFENELTRLSPPENSDDVSDETFDSTAEAAELISPVILERIEPEVDDNEEVAVVTPLEIAEGTDCTADSKPLIVDVDVADLPLVDNVELFVSRALLVVDVYEEDAVFDVMTDGSISAMDYPSARLFARCMDSKSA